MTTKAQITKKFWDIADELRGVFAGELVGEICGFLFLLKRISDTGKSRFRAMPIASSAATIWKALIDAERPEDRFLEILREVETFDSHFDGLATASDIARALPGRVDLRPILQRVIGMADQISTVDLPAPEAADIFRSLLHSWPRATLRPDTPHEVAQLLVGIVAPKPTESVLDPVCGSGTLIAAAARMVGPKADQNVIGKESNKRLALLARLTLWLDGSSAEIHVGDLFASAEQQSARIRQDFDVILANPPFGTRYDRPPPFAKEGNRSTTLLSEVAFVERIDNQLSKTGRAAVLVPIGFLSRQGTDYFLRKDLVKRDRLAAVILLPSGLFQGTKVSVAVVVLHAQKTPNRKERVVFVQVADSLRESSFKPSEINQLRAFIGGAVENYSGAQMIASDAIAKNDFDLAVWRYLPNSDTGDYALSLQTALNDYEDVASARLRAQKTALDAIADAVEALENCRRSGSSPPQGDN